MKGISRRTRACAVVAATGVAAFAGAGIAQAQDRPERVGNGVPTGQGGVQLFNYGGWFNNGGSLGANPPAEFTGVADACRTSTTTECRAVRQEALWAFLKRKGVTNVELFGHAGFPSNTDTAGLQAYRARLDKYGLHVAGWHGDMSEANWDARLNAAKILGSDFVGSGGFPSPGIGPTGGANNGYDNTLRTAETLNRLGKRAVEAGVGPVYFHNHTGEFDNKYSDNGVLKTAWDIIMERTDARYVAGELDVFWSSDAFNDISGEQSAALINKWASRIKMLHMKDGTRVTTQPTPTNSRDGDPMPFGTGDIDFRPILTAARDRVQYYHQEEDQGDLTGAETSLSNLKGVGPNVMGTPLGLPTTFPSVAAGTPAAQNQVAIPIRNTGDAPLDITNVTLATGGNARADESPFDFQVIGNTCVGPDVAPGASCVVNVGFKPTRTNFRSVSRLILTSPADNATEQVLLVGQSTGEALPIGIGGDVPSILSLQLGSGASFGTFQPATARTYETAVAALVTSTAENATLTVVDPSTTAPGHLVNGAYALAQPLNIRAVNAANAGSNPAWVPLGAGPLELLSYAGPSAGADTVTVGLRQTIGASDVLRAGSYGKTLTFTLSTTQP